jgi:1-deoxyxylulose-5-phosphate synthase
MEYVNLGGSGVRVSRICLGMMSFGNNSDRPWVLDEDAAVPLVRQAAESGVIFFDTADVYSGGASEEATGRLLAKHFDRDDIVVATKVYNRMRPGENARGLSRKYVMSAIDASLRRLNMDYVDLYQIHQWDEHTPIDETMDALNDVVRSGKARYIGASNTFAWELAKARHAADRRSWAQFVSVQNQYNLLYREEERETVPFCQDQAVALLPWSPLARGVLTGNRTREGEKRTPRSGADSMSERMYSKSHDFDVVEAVTAVAAERGVSPAQIALAWLLGKPGVTAPVVGATKLAHVADAVAAVDLRLSDDEVRQLEEHYVPHAVLGPRRR